LSAIKEEAKEDEDKESDENKETQEPGLPLIKQLGKRVEDKTKNNLLH